MIKLPLAYTFFFLSLSLMKRSVIINFSLNHSGCSHGILKETVVQLKFPLPCLRVSQFPELEVIKYLDWCDL